MKNKPYPSTFKRWMKATSLVVMILLVLGQAAQAESELFLRPLSALERDVGNSFDKDKFVERIGKIFKPEKYGHYWLLKHGKISARYGIGRDEIKIRLYIEYPRTQDENGLYDGGFTCYEGAYKIKRWLNERGIPATMCTGKTGFWDAHFYVETPDGTKFSATPDSPYVDAPIEKTGSVSDKTADKMYADMQNRAPIDEGYEPMKWQIIDNDTGILAEAGIYFDLVSVSGKHSSYLPFYYEGDFDLVFNYNLVFVQSGRSKGEVRFRCAIPRARLAGIQQILAQINPSEVVKDKKLNSTGVPVEITREYKGLENNEKALLKKEEKSNMDILYYLISKVDTSTLPQQPVTNAIKDIKLSNVLMAAI